MSMRHPIYQKFQVAHSKRIRQGVEYLKQRRHKATWKDGLKSFYFRDPDRHVVEIVTKGIWD